MALTRLIRNLCAAALLFSSFGAVGAQAAPTPALSHRHFKTAIYITVRDTKRLADRATFDREFARAHGQLRFDKVWIEAYRDRLFATDDELERVKGYFRSKGIQTEGGITLAAGGQGGQFGTFDYELPADRAEAERAVRTAARHFDTIILDDFFFYTSKSDADIAAKGNRSWTEYRLDTMRRASQDLVIGPAKAENPRVKVIIKYPNWYEHFHGLGFDLDAQPKMFDAIYTGTETRDPIITDQLLQQYESYEIYRYFANIRSDGGNLGGWVDTFSTRSVDRYAEQLWDTLLARAPEITLFNWHPMSEAAPADAGTRPWAAARTTFDWDTIVAGKPDAGWATAANAALDIADKALDSLGKPVGIASYRPPHATGEDFLHNYLGNLGIPIELYPSFPATAGTILLTRSAASDPGIIAKIQERLRSGADVIVTSGFVEATQGKGFEQLAEWQVTGHTIAIDQYFDGYGAGNGVSLTGAATTKPVLFPETRFYTNDSWGIIRGVAAAKGFPIVLMNRYSKGTLFLWTVPDNFGDLYNLPQPMLTRIKEYLFPRAPVRIDAPPQVALFTYDNGAFVVENYRDEAAPVTISLAPPYANLTEVTQNQRIATADEKKPGSVGRRSFSITIPPHSLRVFSPNRALHTNYN
jgi:hypothetical protein